MTVAMASSRASPAAWTGPAPSECDQGEVAGGRGRARSKPNAGRAWYGRWRCGGSPRPRRSRSRPSGGRDAVGDHCGGRLRVDADLAVGERPGADVPEGDVGVGQGRLGAAASVADRAGNGPGAARPYPQAAGGVEEGDAAAAGTDLGDVEAGGAYQLAAAPHQPAPRRQGGADLVLRAVADAAPPRSSMPSPSSPPCRG